MGTVISDNAVIGEYIVEDSAIDTAATNAAPYLQGFSLGFKAVGDVAGVFLSYYNSKNQKKVLKYQAELYRIQAQSYKNAAEDALRQGNQQVASITYQAGQKKARAKVSMAAAGIQVGAGSSAEVLASYDIAKEMQVNQTLANAVTTSFGYRRQQTDFSNKALAKESAASGISPWAVAMTTAFNTLAEAPNELEGSTGSVALDRWATIGSNAKSALGW